MLLQMARFHSFFMAELYSIVYMHFFIHSSADGHLDYFHILVIVSNAAMIIWMIYLLPFYYSYFYIFSFFFKNSHLGHFFIAFRERGRERKKHQLVAARTQLDWGLYMPRSGIEPAPRECALARNQTCSLSVMGGSPTEPHCPWFFFFLKKTL